MSCDEGGGQGAGAYLGLQERRGEEEEEEISRKGGKMGFLKGGRLEFRISFFF